MTAKVREQVGTGSEYIRASGIDFQFLEDIPMDKDFTLYQLLGGFQSVRDGVPELVKNSKDQYSRLGISERRDRQIVVLVSSEHRRVAVLDFAGAQRRDFEVWQVWSNPTASRAQAGQDIEGGHGNGGKAFMVRGSATTSFMESCCKGRRTKMGFRSSDPKMRHHPGYVREDGVAINNVPEPDPQKRLIALLAGFGLTPKDLPPDAQILAERRAFTLVQVNDIAEWRNRRKKTTEEAARAVPRDLAQHPQAALTLESCSVSVIIDGKVHASGELAPVYPEPMPGFQKPEDIAIPDLLVDPDTGEEVSTGEAAGAAKRLTLRTSKTHLRQREHKALNVIRVRNARNIVANLSVPDLVPQNESAFIFGELRLPAIQGEHVSGADRKGLADTSLTRAVRQWTSQHVEDLAARIQKAIAKSHKPEDREKANDSLRQLRELMRRYLDPDPYDGAEDAGGEGRKGENGSGDTPPRREIKWGTKVHKVVLEPGRTKIAMAAGTGVPLVVRCYEMRDGADPLPVIGTRLQLHSADDLGFVFQRDRVLQAGASGKTQIWIEDVDSGVVSEKLDVEVIHCTGVDVIGVERLLLKGERVSIGVSFHTPTGHRGDLLLDASVDEPDMGRFGRSGVFTAGRWQGTASLRVRFGPKTSDSSTTELRIGPESMPPRRKGGQDGGDIPLILLCGTSAPGTDDLPPQQRTHIGGEYHPTIIEDPLFDNVVWINPDSKEGSRVRQGRGGRKGSAGIGTKTFTQFVALKCFEILKRLKVRREAGDSLITELQFRDYLAEAELTCADFVDDAYTLADTLAGTDQKEE